MKKFKSSVIVTAVLLLLSLVLTLATNPFTNKDGQTLASDLPDILSASVDDGEEFASDMPAILSASVDDGEEFASDMPAILSA